MQYEEEEDLRHQIRVGSIQHHILGVLKDSDSKDMETIWGDLLSKEKIRAISLEDLGAKFLKVMKDSDLVSQSGNSFSLTLNGYAILNFLDLKAHWRKDASTTLVKQAMPLWSGIYEGNELKATCPRKGAYDYLSLPSLMSGALVPHSQAHLAQSHRHD